MDKVLVNLYIPSIGKQFDVHIPLFLPIKAVTPLLAKMAEEITAHHYVSSGQELLCSIDRNLLFHQDHTLRDYDVQNGEHLLFS